MVFCYRTIEHSFFKYPSDKTFCNSAANINSSRTVRLHNNYISTVDAKVDVLCLLYATVDIVVVDVGKHVNFVLLHLNALL